jgi:DNA segregation ATPase FtsK/SpoIIIE, S-DNA-T family
MKLYTCKTDGVVSELKKCPVCGKGMLPFTKQLAKKAKRFPRIETPESKAQKDERKRVSTIIEATCETFACPGDVIGSRQGPVVTEYKFRPMRHSRVKNLKSLHEDLAVAIPAENVSVSRAIGEKAMNICVPNLVRQDIPFEPTLAAIVEHRYDMELPINLGVTSVGDPVVIDLTKAGPHMLIAGSTGAGKSVAINSILTSLLYIKSPKDLELLLIDPKQVELTPYAGLPHVKRPPVSGTMESLAMMDTVIQEMKRRMSFLAMMRVKNLRELNAKLTTMGEQTHPYWIMVIDEMGELAITEKKRFTERMAQIAQMARAAGIHIIAATQRPSVDVLSGKIKVNFATRLGLRLPSVGDSRTVFGRSGAEQLLGKGDAFLMSGDTPGLMRCHLPHCTEEDIRKMLTLSSELGHVNNVPADGLKKNGNGKAAPKPEPEKVVESIPEQPKVEETGYLLNAFLREKNTTLESVRSLPREDQLVLNEEFKAWQHLRRSRRRG